MTHFILLLYLISGFSGIGSIIYLIMKYGNNTPYMRGYLKVHFSYTLLMIAALVVLYLRVNVIHSPRIMSVFISIILIGQGLLCHSLSQFSFIINKIKMTRKLKIIWTLIPLSFILLALIQFRLWNTRLAVLPIIIGVTGFIIISIWLARRNFIADKRKTGKENRIWLYFFLGTLLLISGEMILKFRFGFLGEYTINIPLIFLSWNFLNIHQFKINYLNQSPAGKLSLEQTDKWQLTPRERIITVAILRGDSNKMIASDLEISFSTVKNHIYNIYRKTGAKSRIELANLFR